MQEVFFIRAFRSPIGRLMGGLAAVRADDLLAWALSKMVDFHPFLSQHTDIVYVGDSNQAGEDCRNVARQGAILAGLSDSVQGLSFNSLCLSGMEALLAAVRSIQTGENSVALVAAVENMSRSPYISHRLTGEKADSLIGWRFNNPKFPIPTYSMVETAELMSEKYQISRQAQDDYAHESRELYQRGLSQGYFGQEIIPFELENGQLFGKDEQHKRIEWGNYPNFPPLVEGGQYISLCNSARAGDGVSIVLICDKKTVENFALTPIAKYKLAATAAVNASEMSYSGIAAARKLLKKADFSPKFDIIEQSESFAMQTLLHIRELGWDRALVNPYGGALSVGNPTSVGNLRLVGAMLNHFQQDKTRRHGLISASAGLGIGAGLWLQSLI